MFFRIQMLPIVLCAVLVGACAHGPQPFPVAPMSESSEVGPSDSEAAARGARAPTEKTPLENTLKWTTASEVENFGFDIYRALLEEGPFEKITPDPLAGAGTTDEPQSYVFKDDEIQAGVDFFYYIESISMAGVREKFSPVIKAPAKN